MMSIAGTTFSKFISGDDIDAACGQLAGDVMDKTSRKERYLKKLGEVNE